MEENNEKGSGWFEDLILKIKAAFGKGRQGRGVLLTSLLLAAAGCVGIFAAVLWRPEQPEKTAGNPAAEVRTLSADEGELSAETAGEAAEPETEEARGDSEGIPEIDFEAQWEINPDICGWICMPQTLVDCPVLRNGSSGDPHDAYYLDTTVGGERGLPGSIYMEPCNSPEFTDFNTVIYGHNMKNGTMFGELDKLEDEAFFEAHEFVYIVTPDKVRVYRVYGWVNYDDRHIMASYDFSEEEQCRAFLDSLSEDGTESRFREEMEVTPKDRLLTLSTCVKGQEDRRFLVEAVLIEEWER